MSKSHNRQNKSILYDLTSLERVVMFDVNAILFVDFEMVVVRYKLNVRS